MSGSAMLWFTQWVVPWSVRRGLDPDNVSAPLITTLGDLLTIPCVLIAVHITLALPDIVRILILLALAASTLYLYRLSASAISARAFRTLLSERLPVLILCMTVSFVAGIALELLIAHLTALELAVPGTQQRATVRSANAFLVALSPLFNAQGGSGGSVFASRISTYCAVAKIDSTKGLPLVPPRSMQSEALVLCAAIGTIMFGGVATALVIGYHFALVTVVLPLCIGLTALLSGSSLVAYYITKLCIEQSWEADNIGIPVVCATMDFVASWGFVLILMAVYA